MLTQARLAKRLGLSLDYIQKLEVGRKPLLMRHVDDLAQLRPAETRAQDFASLLAELRAAVIARVENKLAQVESERDAAIDPEAIASSVVARMPKLDTSELAASVAAKLPRLPDVDALASGVAARLPKLDTDAVASNLAARLPEPKLDTDEVARKVANALPMSELVRVAVIQFVKSAAREFGPLIGLGSAGGVIVLGCLVLLNADCRHAALSSSAQHFTFNVRTGVAEVATRGELADWLGVPFLQTPAIAMGHRSSPRGPRMMPHEPLRRQAIEPCPSYATTLYGACWGQIANQTAPCPPELYQEGQSCYAPIQADASGPATETPRAPGQEQH